MAEVIAIANQKGGVRKTTTAISLDIGLAIPRCVKVSESTGIGESIFKYNP